MSSIPFTPSFFQNLDAYAQIRDLEMKHPETWETEKKILTWVLKNIPAGGLIYPSDLNGFGENRHLATAALESRGWMAKDNSRHVLTPEGRVVSQVLIEIGDKKISLKYMLFIVLWWYAIVVGLILLTIELFTKLYPILGHLCHNVSNLITGMARQPQ